MCSLKLIPIGNEMGVILPKEVLARLKLDKGDLLRVSDTPDGIALTPCAPEFEEQLVLGRAFMRDYRETFGTLAKLDY